MKNAVVIGMPLAGKSTLLKQLSEKLRRNYAGFRCIILDDEIVRSENRPISEIFLECGEAHFRKLEAALLHDFSKSDGVIVEAGGGAVCTEAGRAAIRGFEKVIYIKCGPDTLIRRAVSHEVKIRPLLSAAASAPQKIYELFEQRDPLYRLLATDIIEADDLNSSDVLEQAIGALFC